jgi:hypothetical protein
MLVGANQSLGEIKQANVNVKLASKHCILVDKLVQNQPHQ